MQITTTWQWWKMWNIPEHRLFLLSSIHSSSKKTFTSGNFWSERKEVVIYKKDIISAQTSNSLLVASRVNWFGPQFLILKKSAQIGQVRLSFYHLQHSVFWKLFCKPFTQQSRNSLLFLKKVLGFVCAFLLNIKVDCNVSAAAGYFFL